MFPQRFLAILLTTTVAASALAAPAAPPRDEDVVAVVNGTSLQRRSVRAIVQGALMSREQATPPDAQTVRRLATDALDSLIDFELLFQASEAHQISIPDSSIDAEVNRTIANFGDKKALDEALRSQGMTEADLRRDTRKSLAVNRLLEGEVFRDLRVTQEQVEQFYKDNQDQFQHPAQTRASHILIRVGKQATKAQKEAAKAKATQILAKLKGGADFAELARSESQDPGSAALGGDLGYFASGEMDDAFEKACAAVQTGQLSGVVSTTYGFHIIVVTERRDAGVDSLAEAQERIRAALLKNERRKRQSEFVAELRKSATIQYPSAL